ncbi:MAG TPA: polyprenyl synthetase family protein [Terracidiphilus sp.]|nr:polyprenyl synthetase family protein [Terracidiphilus sp.]
MLAEPGLDDWNTLYLADRFRGSLPLPAHLDPQFEAALRHVLDNPGSLVRPRMVLQVAEAYGLETGRAHDLAIALEYFHTASLLFDDLPCMDNALERRGAACVHVEHGETGAILSALALINRAYALTWRALAGCPPEWQPAVMAYLEQRLGVEGLLNGQSMDLNYSTLPHTHETTERIARGKTVSLIRLTLVLPAMLAAAPARDQQLLERIALCWGLGYQIVDDLKDILQGSGDSGKTASRDELLDRPNTAAVMGVDGAVARLNRLLRLGDHALARLLARRPALEFLARLRADLQAELARVTENASLMVVSEGA